MSTSSNINMSGTSRDGVALVIVLGLLAVMIIFAVSFTISARTERLASRSYMDVVKARQLVHTALNRVMEDHINQSVTNSYPLWDAFTVSGSTNESVNLLGGLTMESAAVYVPMSVRPAAFAANTNRWLELREPVNDGFIGEYAFLVVNNSGLLDANVIGRLSTLPNSQWVQRGTNASDIFFQPTNHPSLPGVLPEVFANTLNTYRNEFGRFESVPELFYLLSTTQFQNEVATRPMNNRDNITSPLAGTMVDNLHVFSRFPPGYAQGNMSAVTNIAYVGGPTNAWDNDDRITSALTGIDGTPIPDIPAFINNMKDFVTPDYELAGATDADKFNRISSKRVPMINEVIFTNQLVYTPATASLGHNIQMTVETWYPFLETNNTAFYVQLIGSATPLNVTVTAPGGIGSAMSGTYTVNTSNSLAFTPPANSYATHSFVFSLTNTITAPTSPTPFAVSVAMTASIVVRAGDNGPVVDRLNATWTNTLTLAIVPASAFLPGAAMPLNMGLRNGFAANDPRINWTRSGQYATVAGTAVSLGSRNPPAVLQGQPGETNYMFAKREPFSSIGELSYLLFRADRPWQTIRLLGTNNPATVSKVFDRLVVHTNNAPLRGLVNPNTRQTNALAAVFWNTPVEPYPGATAAYSPVSNIMARALAGYVINQIPPNNPLLNLSDLPRRLTNAVDNILNVSNDKFLRESFLRNSIGLLGTRHNIFTIFVAARVFSDNYDPTTMANQKLNYVVAEQRAVAVVWRDPFTTTDGAGNTTHQSWIQYFHWFSGAFGDG